jgi:hypothetical protein
MGKKSSIDGRFEKGLVMAGPLDTSTLIWPRGKPFNKACSDPVAGPKPGVR